MNFFWNWFVKITGWPAQLLCFRTKIAYEDKSTQGRHISGPAIIISNHTSVFDYAVWIFVFWSRTLRFQMAELLFKKPLLGIFLRLLGGIRVDRDSHDFGFLSKSQTVLDRGGVVGIFPESRLPLPGEERPLPFKVSAAYLAITTGAKIIPVYTNGSYFSTRRARVAIGKPLYAADFITGDMDEKTALETVSRCLREKIIELEKLTRGTGE
ncbi:MAG: 1-acyl-sn-glycerol-3-phosphate acyltransferase [Lachnospiraceae bacterium]|nr:1-acyl-sn-glycerol-3-phosphate acyltransferase [Lachnospiraceae bacterium]